MASPPRSKEHDRHKVLCVGLLNPVRTTDPRDEQDVEGSLVQAQIFETPYAPPIGDEPPKPVLFEGPLTDDGVRDGRQVYVASVRPGIEFSDGTPLTAERMVASLSTSDGLSPEASVEADGDQVRFTLSRPNRRFEIVLTNRFCSIVCAEGGVYHGTGAYLPAPDATPERMRLLRNPRFRRQVLIDEVVFAYYPPDRDGRPSRLLAAIRSGAVHFANCLSRDDATGLRGVRKWHQPGNSTAILFFNTERPCLQDVQVRRALALALDRNELTRISYENPVAFTATSLLPPFMGEWSDGIRPDVERAKSLLGEASGRLPDRLSILLPWGPRPYLPQAEQVAAAIGRQLARLGVGLEPVATSDATDFYGRIADDDYDLALVGWIADTADSADFLEAVLSSRNIPERGRSPAVRANMARWRDDEVDSALARHRLEPSEDSKTAILRLVATQVPLLPLMYGPMLAVHTWSLKGFSASPIALPIFSDLDLQT